MIAMTPRPGRLPRYRTLTVRRLLRQRLTQLLVLTLVTQIAVLCGVPIRPLETLVLAAFLGNYIWALLRALRQVD